MARLLSVNVGQPREIAWRGKIVYTSVWNQPAHQPAGRSDDVVEAHR
jgi:hypothetical protein